MLKRVRLEIVAKASVEDPPTRATPNSSKPQAPRVWPQRGCEGRVGRFEEPAHPGVSYLLQGGGLQCNNYLALNLLCGAVHAGAVSLVGASCV